MTLQENRPDNDAAKRELLYRALALPLALLAARLIVGTGMRTAVRMLTMVLHESGHAITAWLTGRWAIPLLWVTMRGYERSFGVALAVFATIVFCGYWEAAARRWTWFGVALFMLVLQLLCMTVWQRYAEPFIVFFGDGGALVLATLLMAMFYADFGGKDSDSLVSSNRGLRWGLLAIGSAAFMDVYSTWSGPWGDLPFGEQEGVGLSDPSVLTEINGWSVPLMVDRYLLVAKVCLCALAVVYVWGLVSAYADLCALKSQAATQQAGSRA